MSPLFYKDTKRTAIDVDNVRLTTSLFLQLSVVSPTCLSTIRPLPHSHSQWSQRSYVTQHLCFPPRHLGGNPCNAKTYCTLFGYLTSLAIVVPKNSSKTISQMLWPMQVSTNQVLSGNFTSSLSLSPSFLSCPVYKTMQCPKDWKTPKTQNFF